MASTATSLTADGDVAVHGIAQEIFGEDLVSNQDPNHYAKGVENCFGELVDMHPCLAAVANKLKPHFLLGALSLWLCCLLPGMCSGLTVCGSFHSGVKLFRQHKEGFCAHMWAFIGHVTDQDHSRCCHDPRPPKPCPTLDARKYPDAVAALATFIDSYLDNCDRFLHGFNTIQNKSINGSFRKRNNKHRNWTVMYGPLTNLGIYERNEGVDTVHACALNKCWQVC
jgi:hypothetical protein